MRFSTVAIAVAAVAPLVNAHGGSFPDIVGLDVEDLRNLRARVVDAGSSDGKSMLKARVAADGRECGEGVGSCPAGKCCSISGYCGSTDAYCYSPGCNYKYGPACAENQPPKGEDTSSFKRNKPGRVPYGGTGLFRCVENGTVALTFDDGPQKKFTSHILDVFKKYNAKGTFFVTGNNINKGQIDITDEFVKVIKRMDAEGHQIGSHTWTHLDLSKISSDDRSNQIFYNERAINNIIGKIPTYMRPPYSSCTVESGCEKQLSDLGYHIAYFNVDTDDYNQKSAELPEKWFKGNITKTGNRDDPWISISHDILEFTAMDLTEYMLSTVTQLGYKVVTVGECLGDPEGNWYRTANGTGYVADSEYPSLDLPYPNVSTTGVLPMSATQTSSSGTETPTGTSGTSSSEPTNTDSSEVPKEGAASLNVSLNAFVSFAALTLSLSFAFA